MLVIVPLIIDHNFITEMHPLSSLANLTEIMLIHNCIIHISGL